MKEKYTAEELGLDSNLPDLETITNKFLLLQITVLPKVENAIVGDFVVPKITHMSNEL